MAEDKEYQYLKGGDEKGGALDDLNARLAADLRKSVRKLGNFPILSTAWIEMVDSLTRMATVTEMEGNLPQSKKEATLWETEEQAVRFILEDAKLNLLLRSMVEYKEYQRRKSSSLEGLEDKSRIKECDDFEIGLGGVLRACWLHVEGIQVTDLPNLMNHINEVMRHALSNPGYLKDLESRGNLVKRQEVMGMLYIGQILQHVETIGEQRFMPLIRGCGVFMTSIKFLFQTFNLLPEDKLFTILTMLSTLVDTEDFVTYLSQYVPQAEDVSDLVDFKKEIVMPLQRSASVEQRRALRPLCDAIDKCKRTMGSKK